MPYKYSAQHHDWDLTLQASFETLEVAQLFSRQSERATPYTVFSLFTSSMLLSFCAIESFSASVAFSMPAIDRFKCFGFEDYRKSRRFWDKVEMLCGAIGVVVDKSEGLFQVIGEMQIWRNLVTHSVPYEIGEVTIENTTIEPRQLHRAYRDKEYVRSVDEANARKFYSTATQYVELISAESGINPRATNTYRVGTE